MFREFLSGSPHLAGPLAALVIFFIIFLGVLLGLVRGLVRRRSFDEVAGLPLQDDRPAVHRGGSAR